MIDATLMHHITLARTEIHTCGWLAQVDESGGNIFAYRPHSRGAEDMALLVQELLELLGKTEPVNATNNELPSVDSIESTSRESYTVLPIPPSDIGSVGDYENRHTPDHAGKSGEPHADRAVGDGGLSDNRTTYHEAA